MAAAAATALRRWVEPLGAKQQDGAEEGGGDIGNGGAGGNGGRNLGGGRGGGLGVLGGGQLLFGVAGWPLFGGVPRWQKKPKRLASQEERS